MDFIVVYITAPNEDEAVKISKTLVGEKLAACANIIRDIRSIYAWEGKVNDDPEVLMIVKTRKEFFGKLKTRVTEMHSYSVPEIIALPIIEGSEDYLKWLSEETG